MTHVNIEKTLEVLVRVGNKVLTIRSIDTAVSVIDTGVLKLLAGRGVDLDTLRSDSLPRSKSERASLDSIGRGHELCILVSHQIKVSSRRAGGKGI
jgi:hypothetical protein